MRRPPVRLAALLCVAVALSGTAGSAAAQDRAEEPVEQLEDVVRRLDDARSDVERLDERRTVTLDDLRDIDAQRAVLEQELDELGAELATAQQRLDRAQRQLTATNAGLIDTERRLLASHEHLDARRDVMSHHVRMAYQMGAAGYAATLLQANDLSEFTRGMGYVRAVIAEDSRQVDDLVMLRRGVDDLHGQLETLRDRSARNRDTFAVRERRVATVVAERRMVHERLITASEQRRDVLERIDSDQASHTRLISRLQSDEARLRQQLRQSAERSTTPAPAGHPAPAPLPTGTRMHRPVDGPVTSPFGWRVHPIFGTRRLHAGADIGVASGTPIEAAETGTVYSAGWLGGYGNAVILDHGGGITTLYAHQSQLAVSSGETVVRGQVIGYVGSTGYATGPHLHFEVRRDGVPEDPLAWL